MQLNSPDEKGPPNGSKSQQECLDALLGYLNFSSGAFDPQPFISLNALYEHFESPDNKSAEVPPETPVWQKLEAALRGRLETLIADSAPAFADHTQVSAVLDLVFHDVIPGYRRFHADLLFHHTDDTLFRPYFVGRIFEVVLQQQSPWDQVNRITSGAIRQLNDYVGHRPVATLENRLHHPYDHEWVRPIPVYIKGVGVAKTVGDLPRREVISLAIELLRNTDEDLLRAAQFDPNLLDELAIDPRGYDFDHPVNRRPSYHFGIWDPHQIDNDGNYRRFVLQEVTLQALMARVEPDETTADLTEEERKFEAASVLAGTILMASGMCGRGPGVFDSMTSLTSLLPNIVRYRDAFYHRLLDRMEGSHGERLRKEADEKLQPFGAARQHLNAELARRRAEQVAHVHLAKVFARMGFPKHAAAEADCVSVAAARMRCRIDCHLTAGYRAAKVDKLDEAAALLDKITGLLQRAIECGAIVDPWNILGFDANYSLFDGPENSVRDHRIDELIELMDQIFGLYARVWSEAAAADNQEIASKMSDDFRSLADWWRAFAAHQVSSVEATDPQETYEAAEHVARSLALWHSGGAATGDVRFWAPHADLFDSPRAYALVVESLFERGDLVAAQALLTRWLLEAPRIGLQDGDSSFHRLVLQFQVEIRENEDAWGDRFKLSRRFLDFIDANAGPFGNVPNFRLSQAKDAPSTSLGDELVAGDAEGSEDDDELDTFSAAYENVTYMDSTDDGVEGSIFESSEEESDDELEAEARRISDRLAYLSRLAGLWKLTAAIVAPDETTAAGEAASAQPAPEDFLDSLAMWIGAADHHCRKLTKLLSDIESLKISQPRGDQESLVAYDRRWQIKESLIERTVTAIVLMASARRMLRAAMEAGGRNGHSLTDELAEEADSERDRELSVPLFAALLRNDPDACRQQWPLFLEALSEKELLYIPVAKGGAPRKVAEVRIRQQMIHDLLVWLPRLGMLSEACGLLETARRMEQKHNVGAGSVTEYNNLFTAGYRALVTAIVDSADTWRPTEGAEPKDVPAQLVECLEQLTEVSLVNWLSHSLTLRLSVLEKVKKDPPWQKLVTFIKTYGEDLFDHRFFKIGNLRAILHQGVAVWLQQLQQSEAVDNVRLLQDIGNTIKLEDAAEQLTIVLESILENFNEFRDYNSTTTQSDRGDLLYTLLDFLRIRAAYDRIAWNLRPVILAHEILVRRGQNVAARMWRRALAERSNEEAESFKTRFKELQTKYSMRMPSVADRLSERFIKPLAIDSTRALVKLAMDEAWEGANPATTFNLLVKETQHLLREPGGVGFEVPKWVQALEEEIEAILRPAHRQEDILLMRLPRRQLTRDQVLGQLQNLGGTLRQHGLPGKKPEK